MLMAFDPGYLVFSQFSFQVIYVCTLFILYLYFFLLTLKLVKITKEFVFNIFLVHKKYDRPTNKNYTNS